MWFKLLLVKALLFVLTLTGQNQAVLDTINSLPPDLKAEAEVFLTQTATPAAAGATETLDATQTPDVLAPFGLTETPEAGETPEAEMTEMPEPTEKAEAEDFSLTGVLTAFNGDVWTVDGQTVVVTGAQIEGVPQVGATVKIEFIRNADGSLQVKSVEVKSESLGSDSEDDHGDDSGEEHDGGGDDSNDSDESHSGDSNGD